LSCSTSIYNQRYNAEPEWDGSKALENWYYWWIEAVVSKRRAGPDDRDNNKVPGAKNEIDAVKTEVKTPE